MEKALDVLAALVLKLLDRRPAKPSAEDLNCLKSCSLGSANLKRLIHRLTLPAKSDLSHIL